MIPEFSSQGKQMTQLERADGLQNMQVLSQRKQVKISIFPLRGSFIFFPVTSNIHNSKLNSTREMVKLLILYSALAWLKLWLRHDFSILAACFWSRGQRVVQELSTGWSCLNWKHQWALPWDSKGKPIKASLVLAMLFQIYHCMATGTHWLY